LLAWQQQQFSSGNKNKWWIDRKIKFVIDVFMIRREHTDCAEMTTVRIKCH